MKVTGVISLDLTPFVNEHDSLDKLEALMHAYRVLADLPPNSIVVINIGTSMWPEHLLYELLVDHGLLHNAATVQITGTNSHAVTRAVQVLQLNAGVRA